MSIIIRLLLLNRRSFRRVLSIFTIILGMAKPGARQKGHFIKPSRGRNKKNNFCFYDFVAVTL